MAKAEHKNLQHKFHKGGGALKKAGHGGMIHTKAGGKGKGNFMVTTSNVGKIGHKA